MLHLKYIVMEGNSIVNFALWILMWFVLVIKAVECIGINELWIGFGVSYSFCLFATHQIAGALGPQ